MRRRWLGAVQYCDEGIVNACKSFKFVGRRETVATMLDMLVITCMLVREP